jgi:carbon storage regulator CsrA
MLVLSRKKNQSIILDGNISIEVLQIKGNTVRLGINAPKSVRVLRGELKPFGMAGESVVEFSLENPDSVVSQAG